MWFSIMFYSLAVLAGTTYPRSCIESHTTYRVVSSCPTTETEVKESARINDCESLAKSQNCTDPSKFKYHCVINPRETALIEVCAPTYFIIGYCAEYNIQGARIQDHYERKCTEFSPPCPSRYISTDAYKFPGCYGLVEKKELTTSINDTVEGHASIGWIAAVFAIIITITITISITIIIIYVLHRRKRVTRFNEDWRDNEEMHTLCPISEEHRGMEERSIESEIKQPFTKINALDKIIQTLDFKRYVVIKGDRGDGKTILAQNAIAEMRRKNGKESLNITESEEWDELVPQHRNHVIFIDNMFGEASPLDVTQWSSRLRSMKAMVAGNTNRNCVIITLQTKIFKQIHVCLDMDIKDFLADVMLDISVEGKYHLTHQEKKQLQNRCNFQTNAW